MAEINQFGLVGLSGDVQLGKSGARLLDDNSNSVFKARNSGNSGFVKMKGAEATADDEFIVQAQLPAASTQLGFARKTINYNDSGAQTIATIPANCAVTQVDIIVGTAWTGANAATQIVVGDSDDANQYFNNAVDFTTAGTYRSTYKEAYDSGTNITATVTQGGASAGTATVLVKLKHKTIKTRAGNIPTDYGDLS